MIKHLNTQTIKKACLIGIIFMLLFPLAQEYLFIFKLRPLAGYFETAENIEFRKRKWLSGEFQEKKEKYINQNHGLRSLLVRLNNQIDLMLFNKINAQGVTLGKDGVFFEEPYIDSYLGLDFVGEDSIKKIVKDVAYIQKALGERNKTLLVVVAPGKGYFYPEKFPVQYDDKEKSTSNYEVFAKELKSNGINSIDFNKWFMDNKGKTSYPLITELGIHWTCYGSMMALDSIVKFVEEKRKIDLPDIIFKGYLESDTLWPPDGDIFESANLLVNMHHAKTAYPQIELNFKDKANPPNLLTIADSFWWNVYNSSFTSKIFGEGRFWYYNTDVYPDSKFKPTKVNDINFGEIIDKTDIIILCYTEHNLKKLGNGFVEEMKNYFIKDVGLLTPKEREINEFIDYIKKDVNWMKGLNEKSKKEGISIDTLIYRDAKWQVENKN